MPIKRLKDFLDQNKVKYTSITHSVEYTAQEIAAAAHIPGKNLAKTVIVRLDDKIVMVVLPATYKIDFHLLKEATGASNVELVPEEEFERMFPGCETGAMPPFGNLYGIEVLVSKTLAEDDEIAFNAGTHLELIQLAYDDFEKLVHPTVVKVSTRI